MNQSEFEIHSNREIAPGVFRLTLGGKSDGCRPGQFVDLRIDGLFLRRPISVCDAGKEGITLIYKVVGEGTARLSRMQSGRLDALAFLGNGYDTTLSGSHPVLLGGGVGAPPLYLLCRRLREEGKQVTVVLGFNRAEEIFLADEFEALGASVLITTADGSRGIRGFVTDVLPSLSYSYFYACGPEPMLRVVSEATVTSGQLSFEERMGCGFGVCMGCSCKTLTGNKRICREGPVMRKEEILWPTSR